MQTFNTCHRPWNKSTYINRQVWLSLISDNYPPGCCFCNVCWKQTIKVRLDIFKILDVLYRDFDIFKTLKHQSRDFLVIYVYKSLQPSQICHQLLKLCEKVYQQTCSYCTVGILQTSDFSNGFVYCQTGTTWSTLDSDEC